jgi:hypothetical protein
MGSKIGNSANEIWRNTPKKNKKLLERRKGGEGGVLNYLGWLQRIESYPRDISNQPIINSMSLKYFEMKRSNTQAEPGAHTLPEESIKVRRNSEAGMVIFFNMGPRSRLEANFVPCNWLFLIVLVGWMDWIGFRAFPFEESTFC